MNKIILIIVAITISYACYQIFLPLNKTKIKHPPETYFKSKKVQKFCYALIQNDFETADALLEKGLDINTIGNKVKNKREGEYAPTPLVWLFLANKDTPKKLKAFEYLLQKGANPLVIHDTHDSTMLFEASGYEYPDYLKMILESGNVKKENLNIDLNTGTMNTPLMHAMATRFENFKLLLDHGADMNWIEERSGRSTLQYCSMNGNWKFAYELLIRGVDYEKDLPHIVQVIQMEGIGATYEATTAYNWMGYDPRQKVVQFFRAKGIEINPGMNPYEKYVLENGEDVLYVDKSYFDEKGQFLGWKKIKESVQEKGQWVKFLDSHIYEGTTEDPDTQIYLEEKWAGKAENVKIKEEEASYKLQRAIVDVVN